MVTFADRFNDVLSDITDQAEREASMKLFQRMAPVFDEAVQDVVQDELQRRGLNGVPRMRDHDVRFQNMLSVWKNNGYHPSNPSKRIEYKDLARRDKQHMKDFENGKLKPEEFVYRDNSGAFYWDNPFLVPRVIAAIVREPIEINQVLTGLLARLRFDNPMQSIVIPAVSAYAAGDLEIAEGDPYPEGQFEYAGTVTATIGKYGISVRFTEDQIRYSHYDVMSMHLRAAGIALARYKEQKVADHILSLGTSSFDNSSATAAHTTGRDSAGLFNGTFTLQDLHTMYAEMLNDGFRPNALLLNPMAWTLFVQDPVMRNWAYNLGPKQIWQTVQGEVATMQSWANRGQSNGLNNNTFVTDPKQVMTTYTSVPSMFPYPLEIIVSPFIPFNGTTSTTDLVLCDKNELGILSVNEDPTTDQWDDPERDIMKVKIRERWAINIMNDGKAIRTAKNVRLARSYDYDDKLTWAAGSGALPTGESTEFTALQS